MSAFGSRKPTVLVVEDDPHSLAFMESSLELSGFTVIQADSAEQAQQKCRDTGLDSISVIISDYRLPRGSGLDFLDWVRALDPAIATIIITGQGEKAIVQQSLAVGVYQYIEKPITHQDLRELARKAAEQTRIRRKYAADRVGLEALEAFDQSMNLVIPEPLQKRMKVFYRPLHEVGGDFFITHDFHGDRWILLVGDISGHDIRSGYVSTYFQGMFRGSLESGGRIEQALQLFNRSLRRQSAQAGDHTGIISLSLSAIDFGPKHDIVQHWNYGFTPCQLVSDSGRIRECPYGRFPLGWVEDISTDPVPIIVKGNSLLYIFTDGLADLGNKLEVNHFSLLYRFMHTLNPLEGLPLEPSDDILAIRFQLNPSFPLSQFFEPILSEHYAGTEVEHIDHLQANWRRSITFALGDRLGDRLYELLICIREGMLNAFIHGCGRAPDKFAHLQISLNDAKNLVRVHIDDPGRGHSFDLQQRVRAIGKESGKHLGLGIIQHLSDEFVIENRGTSLVFDFEINPENPDL